MIIGVDQKARCFGGQKGKEFYGIYHDQEWGVPVRDSKKLFEILALEGMQAGLNWELILKRREGYRAVFYKLDPDFLAVMTEGKIEQALQDSRIIRNRKKVEALRQNAQAFLALEKELCFSEFIWSFVSDKPQVNAWESLDQVPCCTPLSEKLSAELKQWGMVFVGPRIIYSFMQAAGLINDHCKECWLQK